jgi:hypothetical protein
VELAGAGVGTALVLLEDRAEGLDRRLPPLLLVGAGDGAGGGAGVGDAGEELPAGEELAVVRDRLEQLDGRGELPLRVEPAAEQVVQLPLDRLERRLIQLGALVRAVPVRALTPPVGRENLDGL